MTTIHKTIDNIIIITAWLNEWINNKIRTISYPYIYTIHYTQSLFVHLYSIHQSINQSIFNASEWTPVLLCDDDSINWSYHTSISLMHRIIVTVNYKICRWVECIETNILENLISQNKLKNFAYAKIIPSLCFVAMWGSKFFSICSTKSIN